MNKILTFLIVFLLNSNVLNAQDEGDLLSMLGEEKTTDFTAATFKTNRIINGHSIENTARGILDFKISHRFNALRNGLYDLIGLDGASIRFGFDYGISDKLMIGIGRSSREKMFDGFVKYKVLRQSTGKKNMPISLSYLIDGQIKSEKFDIADRKNYFSSRVYYTHQLLLARKMNEKISLQLMPTVIHRNLTLSKADKNDVIAIGLGGRYKLTKRMAVCAEYYHVLPDQLATDYYNSLSLGLDIETGGHVFQLHFTNSQDMTYKGFITETGEGWVFENPANGKMLSGLRFGFNISRVFTVNRPKVN